MNVRKYLWVPSVLLIACASGSASVQSRVVTHSGEPKVLMAVTCVILDVRDSDPAFDTRAFLVERFAARGWSACSSKDAELRIAYTAGPGVCIDCGVNDGYSGFALLAVSNVNEREIASFEWQGSRASSARELAEQFASDIDRLSR